MATADTVDARESEKTVPMRVNAGFAATFRSLCGALGVNAADELERRMRPALEQMKAEAVARLNGRR